MCYFLFSFILSPIHALYDLNNNAPLSYTVQFKGTSIVKGQHSSQTNTNAVMSFSFNIDADDRMDSSNEQLLRWTIGPLKGLNMEALIWGRAIEGLTNDLAYSVLLPGGQGLAVRKDGSISIAGNILNVFMPATNTRTEFNPAFYATNGFNQEEVIEVQREGWDFISGSSENTPPFFIKEEESVRTILRWYEERAKAKEPTLFWFQHLRIRMGKSYRNLNTITDLAGVYDINPARGHLRRAMVVGDVFVTTPILSVGSRGSWMLHLNGVFTLGETK
ncbi:MAG: hypothetical protein ACRCY4_04965 [Brevinema sp.]